jgi:hypothetical protein
MQYDLKFYTEYYQFYVQDSQTTSATDDNNFWNPAAGERRLAVLDGLIGVTVAKYAEIDVQVKVLDTKPEPDPSADHIVQTTLNLASGVLQIKCCTNNDTQLELHLPISNYHVRISSFNLDTVVDDEGQDYYRVEIWK